MVPEGVTDGAKRRHRIGLDLKGMLRRKRGPRNSDD